MKTFVFVIILSYSCTFSALTFGKDIFAGYNNSGKEMYIEWSGYIAGLTDVTYEKGARGISKLVFSCIGGSSSSHGWYHGEMVNVTEKHGIDTYKFIFKRILENTTVYVDIEGGSMSCRKG